jgi:hypothetical protein
MGEGGDDDDSDDDESYEGEWCVCVCIYLCVCVCIYLCVCVSVVCIWFSGMERIEVYGVWGRVCELGVGSGLCCVG